MDSVITGRGKIIDIGSKILQDLDIQFKIEGLDVENYSRLYYYFTKNKNKCAELGIDLRKGLWIWGEIGCGKTIAMKVFQDFCAYTGHLGNRRFSMYWFQKIKKDYSDKNFRSEFSQLYGYDALKDICYDEFLRNHNINDYGNKENIAEMLIDERYERFVNDGYITHITTNISPLFIEEKKLMDDRTLDRSAQMFNIIKWEGGTKRI